MDILILAMAKAYVDDTANALGAVKGAPATIESITQVEGGNEVVFAWNGTDGTKQTQTMFVKDGGISGGATITATGVVIAMDCEEGQEIAVSGETAEAVTLVHHGKNFAPCEVLEKVINGITATPTGSGKFRIKGTATGTVYVDFATKAWGWVLPAGTYSFVSFGLVSGVTANIYKDDGTPVCTLSDGAGYGKLFTLDTPTKVYGYYRVDERVVDVDTVVSVMLERDGEIATSVYTPYNGEKIQSTMLPVTLKAYDGENVIYTENGDILTASADKTVTQIINDAVAKQLAVNWSVYGMPILQLKGETAGMSKDDAVTLEYAYGNRSGTCTAKWQGASSLSWPKKNYTIKFDNAFEAVDGWGEQKKYCLKANYIDFSHARNVVSAKLWGQLVKSRSSVPTELANLINGGAIDGFPCVVMLNGEFHGLYTFNIPKDGWMYGMGSGTKECILSADDHSDSTQFRTEATLDGDFDIEYLADESNTEWVKTSLNNLIRSCVATDGSDLDTTIAGMLDWQSAIDYYIFCVLLRGSDMVDKNYLISTFDGTKWFFGAYDMDSTYGLHWDGLYFVPARNEYTFANAAYYNHVFELIRTHKAAELKARYKYLRSNILSVDNVALAFLNFAGGIHRAVLNEDCNRWPTIPNTSTNTVNQIVEWYRVRCERIDAEVDGWTT